MRRRSCNECGIQPVLIGDSKCYVCRMVVDNRELRDESPEMNNRERELCRIIGEQQKTLTIMYVCFGSLVGIFVICGIIEYLY